MDQLHVEVELTGFNELVGQVYNAIRSWEYQNRGREPIGILLHPKIAYQILSGNRLPGDSWVKIMPEGKFELFNTKVYRSVDIEENKIIVF